MDQNFITEINYQSTDLLPINLTKLFKSAYPPTSWISSAVVFFPFLFLSCCLCCFVFHLLLILCSKETHVSVTSTSPSCFAGQWPSVVLVGCEMRYVPIHFSFHLKETLVCQNSISECIPTKANSRQVLIFPHSKLGKTEFRTLFLGMRAIKRFGENCFKGGVQLPFVNKILATNLRKNVASLQVLFQWDGSEPTNIFTSCELELAPSFTFHVSTATMCLYWNLTEIPWNYKCWRWT